MLRLIAAVIVILLLIGPILVRIGLVDDQGLLREFVDLEIRFFSYLADSVRSFWNRYA